MWHGPMSCAISFLHSFALPSNHKHIHTCMQHRWISKVTLTTGPCHISHMLECMYACVCKYICVNIYKYTYNSKKPSPLSHLLDFCVLILYRGYCSCGGSLCGQGWCAKEHTKKRALFAEELYKKSEGPACKGALQKEGSVYKRFLVLELER